MLSRNIFYQLGSVAKSCARHIPITSKFLFMRFCQTVASFQYWNLSDLPTGISTRIYRHLIIRASCSDVHVITYKEIDTHFNFILNVKILLKIYRKIGITNLITVIIRVLEPKVTRQLKYHRLKTRLIAITRQMLKFPSSPFPNDASAIKFTCLDRLFDCVEKPLFWRYR